MCFGKNTKKECAAIKRLLKKDIEIIEESADWAAISAVDSKEVDLFIPISYIK